MTFDHVINDTMRNILTKEQSPSDTDILYGLLHTGQCQAKDFDNPAVDYSIWKLRDEALYRADDYYEAKQFDKALDELKKVWTY